MQMNADSTTAAPPPLNMAMHNTETRTPGRTAFVASYMETLDVPTLVKNKCPEAAVYLILAFPSGRAIGLFCVHEESEQPMQRQTAVDLTVIQARLSSCSRHRIIYSLLKL